MRIGTQARYSSVDTPTGAATMTRSQRTQSAQSLDKVAVFARLPADTLARIQKRCTWRHYEPGEPIVDHLDTSNDVYFITAGQARVNLYSVAGKAVTFTDLGAGDMFGEYAAIDGARRSATIEARTGCHVASMSAAAFRELLQQEPWLVYTSPSPRDS
jgi:CRP/FNR family transcriptional regulator, cyclic AMP receptor protein